MSETPNDPKDPIPFPVNPHQEVPAQTAELLNQQIPDLAQPPEAPAATPPAQEPAAEPVPPATPTSGQPKGVPGRIYLDCADPETKQSVRLEMPSKFATIVRDMEHTLRTRPDLAEQRAVLLAVGAGPGKDGKPVTFEQPICSGSFKDIIAFVRSRILTKEQAAQAMMQAFAQIANYSKLKLVTVTLLDEDEAGQAVSGGYTLLFVPEADVPTGALKQHYAAIVGQAEEFKEKVEKSRKATLASRIVLPGMPGFRAPPKGKK